MKKVTDEARCIDLSGTYALYGEGEPGMATTFRGGRFALDEMLGQDISQQQKKDTRHVQLIHHKQGIIELIFRGSMDVLARKLVSPPESRLSCEPGKVIIRSSVEGVGEAVTGRLSITRTLLIGEDGALIVHVNIISKNRSFIFFWTAREDYRARFKRLS
jgi:hypothetical protein